MSKSKAKSTAKSRPVAKSKTGKRVEAAAQVVEPTVTTVADTPVAVAPEAKPASTARRFTKAEGAVEQNGIRQPGEGCLCRRVWDALDKLRTDGKDATFEAVRELAGSDMADATIRTQRQRWREFNGIRREEKKSARTSGKRATPAVVSEEAQQQSA